MLPAIARIIIKQAVFASYAVVIMGAATGVFAANPVEIAAVTVPQGNICKSTIRQVERANEMPNMLLHAVSLAESGRWKKHLPRARMPAMPQNFERSLENARGHGRMP